MQPLPNKPKATDAYEAAKDLWFSLPVNRRSVRSITTKLNEAGYQVSKTSIGRWAAEWAQEKPPVEQATAQLLPAPHVADTDLSDIPAELRECLSPRLLALAKGQGLDRVENAVVLLADAIGSRAADIAALLLDTETETESVTKGADDTESKKVVEKGKAARSAVTAVATLAQAMQVVQQARALTAMSHRNFGEGDKFMAEAELIRAEAANVRNEGRAAGAKEIPGTASHVTDEVQEQAFEALKGIAGGSGNKK